MNENPAETLSNARGKKGINQDEMAKMLAEKLGQSYSSRQYQKLEAGKFPKYKKEVLRAVDEILGTNLVEQVYEQKNEQNVRPGSDPSPISTLSHDQILSVLTIAIQDQAQARKEQTEILKIQAKWLEQIENKMARRESQAKIEASLEEVLAGVETIADRQGPAIQKILADLDELKRGKNGPS